MKLINNSQTIVVKAPTNTAKKQELAELKRIIIDYKVELETIKKDLLLEQGDLEEKIKVSTSLDEKIISFKDSIVEKEKELTKLSAEVVDANKEYNAKRSKVQNIGKDVEYNILVLEDQRIAIGAGNINKKALENTIEVIKDEIYILEGNKLSLKGDIDDCVSLIKTKNSTIGTLDAKIIDKESQVAGIDLELGKAAPKLKASKRKQQEEDSKIIEKRKELSNVETQIIEKHDAMFLLDQDFLKVSSKITDSKSLLKMYTSKIGQSKSFYDNSVKDVNAIDEIIDSKSKILSGLDKSIETKSNEVESLLQLMDSQRATNEKETVFLDDEKAKIDILNERIRKRESELTAEQLHIDDTKLSLRETIARIKRKYRLEKIDIEV